MVECLTGCVYTEPDGSKHVGEDDTNTLFSEGLSLEFCLGLYHCWLDVLGSSQIFIKINVSIQCVE